MSSLINIMFFLIPPVAIFAALYVALRAVKRGVKPSSAVKRHVLTLVMTSVALIMLTVAISAATDTTAATETTAAATQTDSGFSKGIGMIAAGLSTGLAGIGGGMALAGGTPAAIGATAEDPKNFSKALIFVALGETIALYGVVISVMILSRL